MKLALATAFLYSLKPRGIRFGLKTTGEVLQRLGRPQEKFRSVHVAGTNGKGSTCAFAESILRCAGRKTGLYTSPHLHDFTERFRVNGKQVEARVVEKAFEVLLRDGLGLEPRQVEQWVEQHQLTEKMRPEYWYHQRGEASALCQLTFFEATTIMAFWIFAELGVETAVIEVGMGGRLDATNVIRPAVSVITPVGLEHTEWLGDTVEKIAFEKAGIIKEKVPVVCGPQQPGAQQVIEQVAGQKQAPLYVYGRDFHAEWSGRQVRFFFRGSHLGQTALGLEAAYQLQNAATAVAALLAGGEEFGPLSGEQLMIGLRDAFWPARFERFGPGGELVVDGAHNPHGVKALVESWHRFFGERPVPVVFGVLKEKNVSEMLQLLEPLVERFELATPRDARARPASELTGLVKKPARVHHSVEQAVEALLAAGSRGLVCGSLTVAAEARRFLMEKFGQRGHEW